ncbi:ABC transporter permease [Pseudomonas typographi]|uniref:ABC transporter permease n=1 Tax=Pseudomonas typographi TaxID=2715964 RepID=UPI00168375DF|nr:ABC transporter permease [Pseudomonas typographi]MBD1552626.1 ABC transporter permease [Pseudomonas typographi]
MSDLLYVLSRLLRAVAMILGVVVLCFVLVRLAPGDPAQLMAGDAGIDDPAYIAQLRQSMGLDRPLPEQLLAYVTGIARLDLGYSYPNRASVWSLISERLPATLLLMGSALLLAATVGVLLGVVAARSRQRRRWLDGLIAQGALLLYAIPPFWLAMVLVLVFSVQLNWLPAFGMQEVGGQLHGWALWCDSLAHLLLPCLSLSFLYLAMYVHLARSAMLEVMAQDHVRTAYAKGLGYWRILLAHQLRNALLPVVTMVGLQFGQLASSTLLIEVVYAWPGIGRLLYDALSQRDYALLLGVFLVIGTVVVVMNVLVDLLCRLLDPRIQAGALY